jgi:hypothetical protein
MSENRAGPNEYELESTADLRDEVERTARSLSRRVDGLKTAVALAYLRGYHRGYDDARDGLEPKHPVSERNEPGLTSSSETPDPEPEPPAE